MKHNKIKPTKIDLPAGHKKQGGISKSPPPLYLLCLAKALCLGPPPQTLKSTPDPSLPRQLLLLLLWLTDRSCCCRPCC